MWSSREINGRHVLKRYSRQHFCTFHPNTRTRLSKVLATGYIYLVTVSTVLYSLFLKSAKDLYHSTASSKTSHSTMSSSEHQDGKGEFATTTTRKAASPCVLRRVCAWKPKYLLRPTQTKMLTRSTLSDTGNHPTHPHYAMQFGPLQPYGQYLS